MQTRLLCCCCIYSRVLEFHIAFDVFAHNIVVFVCCVVMCVVCVMSMCAYDGGWGAWSHTHEGRTCMTHHSCCMLSLTHAACPSHVLHFLARACACFPSRMLHFIPRACCCCISLPRAWLICILHACFFLFHAYVSSSRISFLSFTPVCFPSWRYFVFLVHAIWFSRSKYRVCVYVCICCLVIVCRTALIGCSQVKITCFFCLTSWQSCKVAVFIFLLKGNVDVCTIRMASCVQHMCVLHLHLTSTANKCESSETRVTIHRNNVHRLASILRSRARWRLVNASFVKLLLGSTIITSRNWIHRGEWVKIDEVIFQCARNVPCASAMSFCLKQNNKRAQRSHSMCVTHICAIRFATHVG